eukprot:SRR837773.16359.p1 GENE.SRR837773.16359~~SRR837773.16359.p1  ORF type:complete len:229 (+),score=57.39 SRR837773.16359:26-688(+)
MAPRVLALLLTCTAAANAASLDKIMRSEGAMEVDRRGQEFSDEIADITQLVRAARRAKVGNCVGDECECNIPMWKQDDPVCIETGSSWTDEKGNIRQKMRHEGMCTLKCPLEKWWYQEASIIDMECFGGVWWERELDSDPEEVVQIVCRTSTTFYCMFILVILMIAAACLHHVRGRHAKATAAAAAAGTADAPAAGSRHQDSAPAAAPGAATDAPATPHA